MKIDSCKNIESTAQSAECGVIVKGNKMYLALNGAYNSESINEKIQREISMLEEEQEYGNLCQSLYYEGYLGYEERT